MRPFTAMQKPQLAGERFIPNPKLKLMEQCREVMQFRRLAERSQQAYLEWIKRFLVFHREKAESGKWKKGVSSALKNFLPVQMEMEKISRN